MAKRGRKQSPKKRRGKGKKPGEGTRIRFVTWPDSPKEWIEGYVITELNTQFTILTDDGRTYFKFYSDYPDEWRFVNASDNSGE